MASFPWLHPVSVDRVRAEELLRAHGSEEGSFLVREKPGGIETYALSMVVNGLPAHHLIERNGVAFEVNGGPFDHCVSLNELIQKMRAARADWVYPITHPITVNAAADRQHDGNYEMLWETQTDDLYVLQDGETEQSSHAHRGVGPAQAEGAHRVGERVVVDGGYATFESLRPSTDVYGTTPAGGGCDGTYAEPGGVFDGMYAEPEMVGGAPAQHTPGMRLRDMQQPLAAQTDFEYTTNEGIAMRARLGSIRPKHQRLMPEITGDVPQAMAPPRTSMAPLVDNSVGSPSMQRAEKSTPELPPNHPTFNLEHDPDFDEKNKTPELTRKSSKLKQFSSMFRKKKATPKLPQEDVQSGFVMRSIVMLGSAYVDKADSSAVPDGMAKINFVLRANANAAQKMDIGISVFGIVVQSADVSQTIVHQYDIDEITHCFIPHENAARLGIVATRSTPGHQPTSFLMLMEESAAATTFELLDLIRTALVAANCPFVDAGPNAIDANLCVKQEDIHAEPIEFVSYSDVTPGDPAAELAAAAGGMPGPGEPLDGTYAELPASTLNELERGMAQTNLS